MSPLMPKTRPLRTGAELNLRDIVLGEVEKGSFIAWSGKGGHSELPSWEDLVSGFIAIIQGWGC